MTRRRALVAVLAVGLAAVVAFGVGSRDPAGRLARGINRTEALSTAHVDIQATVLEQEVRASGDVAFPDRLHIFTTIAGERRELVVVGDRAWTFTGGEWRRVAGVGRQTDPRALLELLKGPGEPRFAGFELVGIVPTYHVRVDLSAAALEERLRRSGQIGGVAGTGRLDVYVGLFDDRVYRQETDIVEDVAELAPAGAAYRVRTTYTVDYSRFDQPVDIRPPAGN